MDLAQWAEALHDGIVARGSAARNLYLYVDRSDLSEISGLEEGDAVADFCAAFRQQAGAEPFERQWRSSLSWQRTGWEVPCPFLPALAMTVLAVTEDPIGAAHGVYRRLNQLLGLPEEAKAPPGYASQVPSMWSTWNEWLAGPGSRYGRPSARTHAHWTVQGWARSQGLLRYRERLLIEEFISGIRVVPVRSQDRSGGGTEATSERRQLETLADQMLEWLRYRGQEGRSLAALTEDEAAREIVLDVLDDEVERWSAAGRRAHHGVGGSTARALLFYDSWDRTFAGCVEVDDRLRRAPVQVAGENLALTDFDSHLSLPSSLDCAALLARGDSWQLRPDLSARFPPSPVVVLYDEPLLGGLLQVRGKTASRTYTLLCRDALLDEVGEVLADQAPLDVVPVGVDVPGWSWVRTVRPAADSERLRELGIGSLAVAPQAAVAFSGGLRVAGDTYLTGGEPDLILPEPALSEGLVLDGRPLEHHFSFLAKEDETDRAQTPNVAGVRELDHGDQHARAQKPPSGVARGHDGDTRASSVPTSIQPPGETPSAAVTLPLSRLCLDPGQHEVEDRAGLKLGFETVGFLRETPEPSAYWSSVEQAMSPHLNDAEAVGTIDRPSRSRACRASGALVTSVAPPSANSDGRLVLLPPRQHSGGEGRLRLLRSRVLPGRHALVLREDGSLVEVFPTTETWLREIDLAPSTVDVLRAVRDMSPRPAFFLELAPRQGRCTAVEIPTETVLMPGLVKEQQAEHLLSAVTAAHWQLSPGASNERRQRLLSLALRREPSTSAVAATRQAPVSGRRGTGAFEEGQELRADVLDQPEAANPYDDVLNWISERRTASASMAAFAEAWSWSCARHGMAAIADRYRQAITRLCDLGFVEPDWARGRLHAAAPALVELPASNGLLLLTGARPSRLLERFEDDTDANPAVAESASLWLVHRRIQLIDGLPAAPTAVYLEIDTAHPARVLEGLAALGIHTTSDPAPRLLAGVPSWTELTDRATELTASPGNSFQRRRSSLSGATDWDQISSDRAPGLYRFRLAQGDRYAWRSSAEAPLLAVTRAAGVWLDDRRLQATEEQLRRVVHHTGARALDVSAQLGLPWPLRRALTLRTGLLPTVREQPAELAVNRGTHLSYRNVDSDTAEAVGEIVGRVPVQ